MGCEGYTFQPGETLNGYHIHGCLGKGGFAEVYLADCEKYGMVALKHYIYPDLNLDALLDEAFAMAAFNNTSHFVKIHDARFIGPYPVLIMEYMKEGNLRERLENNFFNPEEAAKILYQIGLALKAMHESGFLHRDICPENIFFNEKGEANLGDLGIAVFFKEEAAAYVAGHAPYVAPELVQESRHTFQSDIYSLGIIFYEMLTGKLPYEARFIQELEDLVSEGRLRVEWPIKENLPQKIPPLHKEIVLKATAISPSERSQNVEEMLSVLRSFLEPTDDTVLSSDIDTAIEPHEIERPDWSHLRGHLIGKKDALIQSIAKEKEKEAIEKFSKLLKEKWQNLSNGLKDEMKVALYRASNESFRSKNCYLGLEHILLSMREEGPFGRGLSELGGNLLELRKEIRKYIEYIRSTDVKNPLSPRLEKMLTRAKKDVPEGVGEREFLLEALKERNLVHVLLEEKGISIEKLSREVESYEV